MLVLTRRSGEEIVISEVGIRLRVLSVKGRRVRLGIEAPPHIVIHREEVASRIAKEEGKLNSFPVATSE